MVLLEVLDVLAMVSVVLDEVQWVLVLCEWSIRRFWGFLRGDFFVPQYNV